MRTTEFKPQLSETASQAANILEWLQRGHTITAREALTMFQCFRLAARILDLKRAGHHIECEAVTLTNGKRIGRYRLV